MKTVQPAARWKVPQERFASKEELWVTGLKVEDRIPRAERWGADELVWWREKPTGLSVVDAIERLTSLPKWQVELRDERALWKFFYRDPGAIGLLLEALGHVWTFFGPGQKVALEVDLNQEDQDQACLFIFVVVRPEQMSWAATLLQEIDRAWTLPKLPEIINRICIDLEFAEG